MDPTDYINIEKNGGVVISDPITGTVDKLKGIFDNFYDPNAGVWLGRRALFGTLGVRSMALE